MSILLDRKPLSGRGSRTKMATLAEALEAVDGELPEGRIVIRVEVDGHTVEGVDLFRARDTAIADRDVSVVTGDRKELSLTLLGKLAALIEWLLPQHREVAGMLESGQTTTGLARLGQLLSAWHEIQNAYGNLAKMTGITLGSLRVQDLSGEAVMNEFVQRLEEIQNALGQRDFVLLADILQYEMEGAGANWMSLLEATLGVIDPTLG